MIVLIYSEKVDPKPDIRMGIILCYSVGAGEACSCSATISFVHKQNCSNLPMVMSDKHLLNQGATCRIGGYLAGMWQCCLTTCTTRAQIDIVLPETVLPWAVWVILIAPIFFQLIPLEWSRIESGSLSPWKHVWILFYAYFFFGLGPWNLKRYSKTMFDHFCFVKGPGTSTIWCFWVLIPSDFILNHLNHDSGFYSGSLWQCFLLAFLRIQADKRIKRYKSKKNQEIKQMVPQQTWVWSLTSSGFFDLHHLYRKIGKCSLLRFLLWLLCLYLMWSPFLLLMSPMSLFYFDVAPKHALA